MVIRRHKFGTPTTCSPRDRFAGWSPQHPVSGLLRHALWASVDVVEAHIREMMLAEHSTLREEQLRRMDHRITLIVGSLTASAALIGVGLERQSAALLLTAPIIAGLFGLLHIYHHVAIREIGDYIREHLEIPLGDGLQEWQGWHVTHASPTKRFKRLLLVWHVPIMCVTLVPSVVSIGLSFGFDASYGTRVPLLVAGGLLLCLYLLVYIAEGLGRRRSGAERSHP
jgi:hypothetical protein